MKNLNEFLNERLKKTDFDSLLKVEHFYLNEDDMGADPMAGGDPMGGDPMGGDPMGGDPMGGDPMGGDPMGGDAMGGDAAGGTGFDNAESDKADTEDEDQDDDHEDDPDWTKGVTDPDDVMLTKKPAGETVYDADSVLKAIAGLKASLKPEELSSMEEVQNALELIVNGKKLNIEDVAFDDPDDAMKLINKIEEPLDIKLKNYIDLKIKQPIILQRDQNKSEIAALADDNEKARETIDAMNKQQ